MNDDSYSNCNQDTKNHHSSYNDIQNGMMYVGFTKHFNKGTILRHIITSILFQSGHLAEDTFPGKGRSERRSDQGADASFDA